MRPLVAIVTAAVVVVVSGCPGSGDDDESPQAFCAEMRTMQERIQEAARGPEDLTELPRARDAAAAIADSARNARAAAPDEIRGDVERLTDVTIELAEELRDFYQELIDNPDRATDTRFLSSFQPVTDEDQAALDEAGSRLRPYLSDECGLEVEAPTTTAPPP